MFCNSESNATGKNTGILPGVSWPDDAKTQGKRSSEAVDTNLDDATVRKNEKRKLQQDLKEVEAEMRALKKEMKKLVSERNGVLNKRKAYIRSKDENNKLEEKITKQKNIWLNQQSRKKGVDGPSILEEASEMLSKFVEIQGEANKEWDEINKIRGKLKDRNSKLKQSKKQLDGEWKKLKEDRSEFERKTVECNNRIKDTYAEQERLKSLKKDIETRNEQLDYQTKQHEQSDLVLKNRVILITEREVAATGKQDELKRENALVDDLKKNIYSSLEQKRAAFNENFCRLTSEYLKWASAYSQVVEDTEKEVKYTIAVQEAEDALKETSIVGKYNPELKEENFERQYDEETKVSVEEPGAAVCDTSEEQDVENSSQSEQKLENAISDKGDLEGKVLPVDESDSNKPGELDFMALFEAEVAKKLYPEQEIREDAEVYRELTPTDTNTENIQQALEGKEGESKEDGEDI